MSMIDCRVHIARKPDPKGDRVILTFEYVSLPVLCSQLSLTTHTPARSGKFLPYIKW